MKSRQFLQNVDTLRRMKQGRSGYSGIYVAQLGYVNTDGSISPAKTDAQPGKVWIYTDLNRGSLQVVQGMINPDRTQGKVWVGKNEAGLAEAFKPYISGETVATIGDNLPSAGIPPTPPEVRNDPLPTRLLGGGMVVPQSGLTLYIDAYGAAGLYHATTYDGSSHIPGSADEHRWFALYLLNGVVTAVEQTAQTLASVSGLLIEDAFALSIPTSAYPLFAVSASNGQTDFSTSRFVDLRLHHGDVTPKHNTSASAAPTVNDDSDDGYRVGSLWIDTTADEVYQCTDASAGAANWEQLSGSSSAGVTITDGTTTVNNVTQVNFNAAHFEVVDNMDGTADVNLIGGAGGVFPTNAMIWRQQFVEVNGNASTWGTASGQYGGLIYFQDTPADGDIIEAHFSIAAGTYDIHILGYKASNCPLVDWTLDGSSIATGQDWYNATNALNFTTTISSVTISGDGDHTLRATVNGKHASSSGYEVNVTYVFIR